MKKDRLILSVFLSSYRHWPHVGAGLSSSDSPAPPPCSRTAAESRLLRGLWCLREHLVRPSFHRTPASPPPGSYPLSPPSSHPQPLVHYWFKSSCYGWGHRGLESEPPLRALCCLVQESSWCFETEPSSVLTKRFAARLEIAVRNVKNTLNQNHGTPHLNAAAPRSLPRGLC